MNPPSPSKYPNRDGLPLSQLSPQRVNGRTAKTDELTKASPLISPSRQRKDESSFFAPGIPQSPSLPEVSMFRDHFRTNTDVSGLVKRFEHLDVRDREAESLERRRRQEEALDRAKIAREEAESELARCREELRAQKKEFEECKSRERKASRRIEILMDEMTRAKDQWSSQSSVYEKEIRRARKEAFKSSSAVLKLQEDSKQSQNESIVLRSKLDMADRKAAKSDEDKFTAQYQLVALQEELDKLRSTLRIAEEERERWKRSLQEEDVVRIASQGSIALPDQTQDDIEEVAISPSKVDAEALDSKTVQKLSLADIREQMLAEKRQRLAAQDLVDFLQLECRFRCCKCSRDRSSLHAAGRHTLRHAAAVDRPLHTATSELAEEPSTVVDKHTQLLDDLQVIEDHQLQTQPADSRSLSQRSSALSIRHIQSPGMNDPADHHADLRRPAQIEDMEMHDDELENRRPLTPTTTSHPSVLVVSSTTTKIPIQFTPARAQIQHDTAMTPSTAQQDRESTARHDMAGCTFDREAALAAIAYRRGRAKSFAQSNGTPKRPVIDRVADRRDISAPAIAG